MSRNPRARPQKPPAPPYAYLVSVLLSSRDPRFCCTLVSFCCLRCAASQTSVASPVRSALRTLQSESPSLITLVRLLLHTYSTARTTVHSERSGGGVPGPGGRRQSDHRPRRRQPCGSSFDGSSCASQQSQSQSSQTQCDSDSDSRQPDTVTRTIRLSGERVPYESPNSTVERCAHLPNYDVYIR